MTTGPTHRYVFVAGLHRSGTSLVARMVGCLPGVGAITGAPVPENEGAYLQGAIPHHALHGIPMHFATDPAQHMTEDHPLNRRDTRDRLEADWTPWFPAGVPWRVEKSPVNLTRLRLLQQLFPLAQAVIVLRHPEAVAAAVAKWTDRPAPALIDHWLDAHDILLRDLDYLHAALVLRYEDITADPAGTLGALAGFLDRAAAPPPAEDVQDRNGDYAGATRLSAAQADRAARWGYGPGLQVDRSWHMATRHPLRDIRDRTDQARRST